MKLSLPISLWVGALILFAWGLWVILIVYLAVSVLQLAGIL